MPRIAFLSDIHWRGVTRHEEYHQVFSRVFQALKEEIRPDYIMIGGDIFHTKTQSITPEAIDCITWMFRNLAEIAPVYSILGNHDGNLTNENRQDTISPIVSAMNNSRITLFKKSGNHIIPGTNINLCVFSPFDEAGWSIVSPDEDLINVVMFHGAVKGCKTDSDWVMTSGEVELSMFQPYDFALLGDIHKHQYLDYRNHSGPTRNMKPWIGYPGSLIQQNYGEELVKGFQVWDIRSKTDWDVSFHPVHNDYQYITVSWTGDVDSTLAEALILVDDNLKNKRVRVTGGSSTIFPLQKKQLADLFKEKHGAAEIFFSQDPRRDAEQDEKRIQSKTTSLRNDPEELCRLYDTFIETDTKSSSLREDQKQTAKKFIRSTLTKVRNQEELEEGASRDVVWSIKSLEWENLYRYGADDNQINFSRLNGITGIFSPNKTGKSSVVGALMFALYNTTDRGPVKSAYLINKNKNSGSAKVVFNVAGVDYHLERTVTKSIKRGGVVDEEKAATKLSLSRVDKEGNKEELLSENADSRTDTDKVVRKLIGTSQDFLMTAFASQGGMNRFIEEGSTQRKAILNRFLDLDIFEKLHKLANEELQACNIKATSFAGSPKDIEILEDRIRQLNDETEHTQSKLDDCKPRRDSVRLWLKAHGYEKRLELKNKVRQLNSLIASLEKGLEAGKLEYQRLISSQDKIVAEANSLEGFLSLAEAETVLAEKLKALRHETTILSQCLGDLAAAQKELLRKEGNVKKLSVVPCGTSFPSCHYIKDAHEDQATIQKQKQIVDEESKAYETQKTLVENLKRENAEKALEEIRQKKTRLHQLGMEQVRIEGAINKINSEISLQETKLSGLQEELKQVQSVLSNQEDLDEKIVEEQDLEQECKACEEKLKALWLQLGAATNKLEQVKHDATKIAEILEQQLVFDSIVRAFSKTGIPAFVLKNKLPAINTQLDGILGGVVPFRLQLETEIGSNALDVFIEDRDSRRVIELASGMEKMVASLALRVALINLSSLPRPDLFIIDESFGSLDSENCGRVIELLQSIKSRFKTVLIITHVDEIKEAATTILTINSNGPTSSISFP